MAVTYPSRTLELSAAEVATLDTYVDLELRDLIYDYCPLLALLASSEHDMPGVGGPGVQQALSAVGVKTIRVLRQGGARAELPLEVGTSTNATSWRAGDTLPTYIEDGLTRAESYFAYYTTYAAMLLQTAFENSGPGKKIDRAKHALRLATRGLSNKLETDLASTNADVSGTQKGVPGIQGIFSTTQTSGTNWGISRSSPNTFWRANVDSGGFSFATSGLDKIRTLRNSAARNGAIDTPRLLFSQYAIKGYGIKQIEGVHRVTNMGAAGSGQLSVPTVMFDDMAWLSDENLPSGTLYLLNPEYLFLVFQSEAEGYSETPANPNDQLYSFQKRMVTGMTWGTSDPQRHSIASSITA